MAPEIGFFASAVALVAAAVQAVVATLGAARGKPSWMAVGGRAARAQCAFVTIAFAALAYSFVINDFGVLNVASHSHSLLPIPYRLAAAWGSHEGSMLLWVLMLSLWTAGVMRFTRPLPAETVARVLGVLGGLSAGFLSFMLFTSNPFVRLVPAPAEGLDLSPQLQDVAMILHPPLLYMGYVGFSVAFAFAIAALMSGRLDAAWARWSRPWATLAWMFLTCGIALGSYWAYYELGWGGWWFWDPVENASLMPWLAGTALLHSLAVADKRGAFRSWTVLLAIATFSLSLLGAFLVRSGVLTSVHAFVTDPERGVYLLGFLGIVIGGSLVLYARRAPDVASGQSFDLLSRESLLLSNNVLLSVAAGTVLLGTLYPLIIDVLGKAKLSVGPPYFNTVFVAVMTPAMFLMGVGPIARWRKASLPELAVRLRWAFASSGVAALLIPMVAGDWKPRVSVGLLLACWILTTAAVSVREATKAAGGWRRLSTSRPRGYYGMHLAHAGVAVTIIGITLVSGYQTEKDQRVSVGDEVTVAGYGFRFKGVREVSGPNYLAARADIEVSRHGRIRRTLHPEKRVYAMSRDMMTETAIDAGLFSHLYLSLGEPLGAGAWRVRIQHKPFIGWIWGGAVLMAIGGALAVSDRRFTQARRSPLTQARRSPQEASEGREATTTPGPPRPGLSGAQP